MASPKQQVNKERQDREQIDGLLCEELVFDWLHGAVQPIVATTHSSALAGQDSDYSAYGRTVLSGVAQ